MQLQDLAVAVEGHDDAEALVSSLGSRGYVAVATVDQDRIDARRLVTRNPGIDLERVRSNLRLITERGFHRRQDLESKLQALLEEVEGG